MNAEPAETAVRARNLHFSYDDVPVLHGVDIDLGWGTLTAIAGPNGAGKSTLVEILAGVRTPGAGSVERAGQVALVVQRPAAPDALPLTVRDVVTMGTWNARAPRATRPTRAQRRLQVQDALERVQLADLAARPFSALSGGQRQRALLAQGIARQARIFLLDEPAAGLDADSRERTREMLAAEAARGAAVACVTHDEESIAGAGVVVRLERGARVL
ncbi:ATP-binding cassette domain-containing protein [Kineosporia sp. J2-2]|uniref:ATP-binding cassette domain-containing protein n=1 Tax=Kineosporia corallincola TaxID=2835133 RepID=A0ABS5TAY6_9ACTN|nr:zinc ABC transporter ATP-binding protein AztA [Kineosporia corallincola]MBT0768240.1 ATP-binding cassette domain-containing protein [Kineosporia corallincola]